MREPVVFEEQGAVWMIGTGEDGDGRLVRLGDLR
jgi:hypothetical protein